MGLKNNAVVVLSGGQDSTTCAYWAKERFGEVHGVTFNYGQRHSIEIRAAQEIAAFAGLDSWEVIDVQQVMRAASALTNSDAPLEHSHESDIPTTFVPLRNALFLVVAANYALSKNCLNLVTGVSQSDGAGYPDCRREFIESQERAINLALGIEGFKIYTPLMDLSKRETVELAKTMDGCIEALSYSHTCYAGQRPPCGKCNACVLREQGFKEAGILDPLTAA